MFFALLPSLVAKMVRAVQRMGTLHLGGVCSHCTSGELFALSSILQPGTKSVKALKASSTSSVTKINI